MGNKFLILFAALLLSSDLMALDSPVIQCISLDSADDITITWSQPVDTGLGFNAYVIYYRSASAQQFNSLSEIFDYSQISVTINGSFSGDGSFFIVTTANPGDTSLATDTVSPLIISLFSQGRNVDITWQEIDLPGLDTFYSVYRKMESEETNWAILGKVPFGTTSFRDTIEVCQDTFKYKLDYQGVGGCLISSNHGQKLVKDDIPPPQMNLIYASVDTSSGVVDLGWDLSIVKDAFGYRVFYYDNGFTRFESLFGPGVLAYTYEDFGIDALSQTETLSVAPFDSCFDANTMWYNQAPTELRMQTLFIEKVSYERCEGTTAIKWNMSRKDYPVGVRDLGAFKVYRKTGTGDSELRAILTPQDSVFVDNELDPSASYTYVVTAVDTSLNIEAFSNKLVYEKIAVPAPDVLYLDGVVNNHEIGENAINFSTDSVSDVLRFRLMRSFLEDEDFQSIMVKEFDGSPRQVLVDRSGNAVENSYYYRVDAYDECDAYISSSNVVKSLFIDGFKNQKNYNNNLNWNLAEGFDVDVEVYNLVRAPVGVTESEIYSGTTEFEFEDDLKSVENLSGQICYYVEALEEDGNSFGIQGYSKSNLVCLNYTPKVFLPNAFSPDGDLINDVFLPYSNFVDQLDYHLLIYNRTGNLIYETTEPTVGWPGVGEDVGVYVFVLELTNAFGEKVVYKDKVHLIR